MNNQITVEGLLHFVSSNEHIKATEELLRLGLLDSTADGLFFLDGNGKVISDTPDVNYDDKSIEIPRHSSRGFKEHLDRLITRACGGWVRGYHYDGDYKLFYWDGSSMYKTDSLEVIGLVAGDIGSSYKDALTMLSFRFNDKYLDITHTQAMDLILNSALDNIEAIPGILRKYDANPDSPELATPFLLI